MVAAKFLVEHNHSIVINVLTGIIFLFLLIGHLRKMKKPLALYVQAVLLLVLSANALFAGFLMITGIQAAGIGMSVDELKNTPFDSFLIPGLILFFFNGVFPLFTLIGVLFKPRWQWPDFINLYKDKHWAWACSIYVGVITITWILVQITMIQFSVLQPMVAGIALLILVLALTPRMMQHFTIQYERK